MLSNTHFMMNMFSTISTKLASFYMSQNLPEKIETDIQLPSIDLVPKVDEAEQENTVTINTKQDVKHILFWVIFMLWFGWSSPIIVFFMSLIIYSPSVVIPLIKPILLEFIRECRYVILLCRQHLQQEPGKSV